MYYNSLRYFQIAAEELNVTRAAERLHLTQQALSTHLTKLEAEYGTAFFERRKSGLVLTPEGRRFYEFAVNALELEERAAADIADIRHTRSGSVTVGTTMTRAVTLLPEVIASFSQKYPAVKVSVGITTYHHNELEEKLLSRELDLIIVPVTITPPSTIAAHELERSWFCLSIPRAFIETILSPSETLRGFSELPLSRQKERILSSGLLGRIPFVYSAKRVAQRSRQFLRQFAPENPAVLDLSGCENLFGAAFCGHTAVFTHNTLIRNAVSDDGAPEQFVYYLDAPEFPFSISVYYHQDTRNHAVLSFVSELTDFAEKRRTPPPEEFFASLD